MKLNFMGTNNSDQDCMYVCMYVCTFYYIDNEKI